MDYYFRIHMWEDDDCLDDVVVFTIPLGEVRYREDLRRDMLEAAKKRGYEFDELYDVEWESGGEDDPETIMYAVFDEVAEKHHGKWNIYPLGLPINI